MEALVFFLLAGGTATTFGLVVRFLGNKNIE